MALDRRTILAVLSSGVAASIAGCSDDGTVGTPNDDDDDDEEDSNGTEQSSETDDSGFELGETAVYRNDQEELSFTPMSARLRDLLVYTGSYSNSLSTEAPEQAGHTFLTIEVEAENTGNEPLSLPGDPVLVLDGTQYETTYTGAYSGTGYDQYREIQTGVSVSGWLVYEIEPSESAARLIANFDEFSDSTTAEWGIDLGSLDRETWEYENLSMGDQAEFGIEDQRFTIGPTAIRETQSYTYTYSSGGYEYEDEAATGSKFVLVTIAAENVGSQQVDVPDTYDMSLIAGNSQYSAGYYSGQGGYEGGEIAAGIVRDGLVVFEVDESASSYELQIELTNDITASWSL
jgi:hypothetical protein